MSNFPIFCSTTILSKFPTYVSTTGYLLWQINIIWHRKNTQHSMLDNDDFKKIKLIVTNEKYY